MMHRTASPSAAVVAVDRSGDTVRLTLSGRLTVDALRAPAETLDAVAAGGARQASIDLAQVETMDTSGAWLVLRTMARLREEGAEPRLTGADDGRMALIEAVRAAMPSPPPRPPRPTLTDRIARLGAGVEASAKGFGEGLAFFGLMLARIGRTIVRPGRLRLTSLIYHCGEAGLAATPIVSLMAFMIGVVLAFQGAAQLRTFGAEVFAVDMIAISVLRELGILLTAIIVAGRSGSAFTAAIGSMKVREEIDAMQTLGLDPIEVLALPRALALFFMLPVLGIAANFAGLAGGMLMCWIELDIAPGQFLSRLSDMDLNHLLVGMIKAPFFALLIGAIGCWRGFLVGSSAESVGRQTTTSVVMAIFSVIIADAVFSIFFAELGL